MFTILAAAWALVFADLQLAWAGQGDERSGSELAGLSMAFVAWFGLRWFL